MKPYNESWIQLVGFTSTTMALWEYFSYPQSSSMSRACRKADAVSCGAITRRLSERLQIADSRGGVTRMHGLGRRAEREESWGSRGDTVSGWPRIENKHKNVTIWFTLRLCAIVSNSDDQRKVPERAQERWNSLSAWRISTLRMEI